MSRSLIVVSLFLSTALGDAGDAVAEPLIHNAEIHPLGTAVPDLEHAFSALRQRLSGPAWIAYTVPSPSEIVLRRLCAI